MEPPETTHVYHVPSLEDPLSIRKTTKNSRDPPTANWRRRRGHHVPAREEHLLAREHHAPVYRQLGKTRLVATEVEDDEEHPGGA